MIRNKNGQISKLWSYYTITNILNNEVYIGNMIQGKSGISSYKSQKKVQYPPEQWIVMNRTHETIIDQATWDQTQTMVSQKATPFRKEPEGIFAKKVRCIHCGCRMQSVKNGDKRAFKCNNHALSSDACVGAYISLPKLERIVVAQLQLLSDELLDKNQLVDGIDPFPDLREMKFKLEAEILDLQKRIEDGHTAMRTLYLDKVKGKITAEEYGSLLLQISEEKDASERQIAEFTAQIAEIVKTLAIYNNRHLLADQYVGTRHLTREMVTILIDHIEVGRRGPLSKYTPVEIHWNF